MKRRISFALPVALSALLSGASFGQSDVLKPFRPGQTAAEDPPRAVPLKPFRPGEPAVIP
jgi:hypothetical protein